LPISSSQDKAEILTRLRTVRPDSARRWGRMSAHQMVRHLSDAYRVAAGDKHVSPARGRLPLSWLKWLALRLPLRWPPGIRTRPEIDQEAGGTKPVEFTADLAGLEALVERMPQETRSLDG